MRKDSINIVIVDDSVVFRKFLVHSLETAEGIKVSGTASSGLEALELIQRLRPDLVLMDINMPGMDGFETTTHIMSSNPLPVIIISGEYTPSEVAKTFRALEVGAVDILPKPAGIGSRDHENEVQKLITHIRLMSEIKVVKRNPAAIKQRVITPQPSSDKGFTYDKPLSKNIPFVIGIGASAGGPMAIQKLLLGLTSGFSIPIVIVQHIEPVFAEGFAQWLELTTNRKVVIAANGMELKEGMIVLPPGDVHLGFRSKGILEITKDPPDRRLRPSVHHLFTSIANTYGPDSIGIILTGMGSDGVEGLKLLKEKGGITIAQDAESSMIHGMPGEAIKAGAAKFVFSIEQLINYLNEINRQRSEI
ncbi:MAG: chemotaxis-specific protein-glutamate methyltransferase CheB [Bacteroidetes bacterium]|nr:chemotaxis-specific protein-glutamate methyltransferase CheB [Bacteroidota bacterium]